MTNIYYDDNTYLVMLNGIECRGNTLTLSDNSSNTCIILPYSEHVAWVPTSGKLHVSARGELDSGIPNCKIGDREYVLLPKLIPAIIPCAPTVNYQGDYNGHMITIYTDTVTHMLVENENNFINTIIPIIPQKLEKIDVGDGLLFVAISDGHCHIVLYDYVDYKLLIDRDVDTVEFDESGILLSRNMRDNQGRIITEHVHYENGEYVSDYVNIDRANNHTVTSELVAYDLMESVLSGDYEYADKLLAIEGEMTAATVHEFVGMDCCCYVISKPIYNENIVYVIDNNNTIKSYEIIIKDGMVVDILEI